MFRVVFCLMACAVASAAFSQVKPQVSVPKTIYRGWEGPDGHIITGPTEIIPSDDDRPKRKLYRKKYDTPEPGGEPEE